MIPMHTHYMLIVYIYIYFTLVHFSFNERFPATSETLSISSSGSASHLDDPESTAGSDGRNEPLGRRTNCHTFSLLAMTSNLPAMASSCALCFFLFDDGSRSKRNSEDFG